MDPNETLPVQAARVAAEFAGTWADGWMVDEIARQLNQSEVVPMARLLHVYGEPKAAEMWVQAWIDSEVECGEFDPGQFEYELDDEGLPSVKENWTERIM